MGGINSVESSFKLNLEALKKHHVFMPVRAMEYVTLQGIRQPTVEQNKLNDKQ